MDLWVAGLGCRVHPFPSSTDDIGRPFLSGRLNLSALRRLKLEIRSASDILPPGHGHGYAQALASAFFLEELTLHFEDQYEGYYAADHVRSNEVIDCLVHQSHTFEHLSKLSLRGVPGFAQTLTTFVCNHKLTLIDLELENIQLAPQHSMRDACMVQFLDELKAQLNLKSFKLSGYLGYCGYRVCVFHRSAQRERFESSKLASLERWLVGDGPALTQILCWD